MYESPQRVYLALAAEVIKSQPWDSIADLADEVKRQCARLKLPYNGHQVEKALGLLTGGSKFSPPPSTRAEVEAEMGRPLTDNEARETLKRLAGVNGLIKSMPRAAPSRIDIYAPVYEDEVEHDRY